MHTLLSSLVDCMQMKCPSHLHHIASSVIVASVVKESSNDCCSANFSKGGAAKRSHCIATSVDLGFTISVAKQYMSKNVAEAITLYYTFIFSFHAHRDCN